VLSIWRQSVSIALVLHLVAIAAFGWIWSEISAELTRPRVSGPRTLAIGQPAPVTERVRFASAVGISHEGLGASVGVARAPAAGDDVSCA
jgi:hypothetical protein